MSFLLRTLLVAVGLLLAGPAAVASTITVTTTSDGVAVDNDCTLREAVRSANTNTSVGGCTAGEAGLDQIVFEATLASRRVLVQDSSIQVTEDVTIDGTTTAISEVVLSGGSVNGLFKVLSGTLTLVDLSVRDGSAARGGAIFLASGTTLDASNVRFRDNVATGAAAIDGGGAVFSDTASVTLTNCVFLDNAATGTSGSGGAVFSHEGTLTVTGSTFTSNAASRAGGAIEARGGTLILTNADFASNRTGSNPGNGGALHLSADADATIEGGTVSDNMAAREGGGFWNNTGTMTLTGTAFSGNVASGNAADDGGGALFNNGGTMTLTNVTVADNEATGTAGSGGGLFTLGGTLTVNGGTISGNVANRAGAGVESAGATTALLNVTVIDNVIPEARSNPGNGGGVHAGGGTLTVLGGTYADNDARHGGGLWASGVLLIDRSTIGDAVFERNSSRSPSTFIGGGGAVYLASGAAATVTNTQIRDNTAAATGGGILVSEGATLVATATTISGNQAPTSGAGIEVNAGTLTLVRSTVTANVIPRDLSGGQESRGGGLFVRGGRADIQGGLFADNEAPSGAGMAALGTLTTRPDENGNGTVIRDNDAYGSLATMGGGGVYVGSGLATLRGTTIAGNEASGASGSGGGLFVAQSASAFIFGGTIADNVANRAGGGIEVAGGAGTSTRLRLADATVDGNRIGTAAPGNGGGIHLGGESSAEIVRSTISANIAREGGGLWVAGGSTATVGNSTVTGNAASEDGGGVYDDGGADIDLSSVTVALNTAGGIGGGVRSQSTDGASFTIGNTVLGSNAASAGDDCSGAITDGGTNFVEDPAGCDFDSATTITGQDPMLGPLANNGGPTRTHLPLAGSPLINAGQSAFEIDQRGLGRNPFTDVDDTIGAVEFDARPVADEGTPEAATLAFALRPNPAVGRAQLAFTVGEAAPVRIDVYNTLGQRVQTAFDGLGTPGREQTVGVDLSRLAAGVYLVRLETAGQALVRQLTVVR